MINKFALFYGLQTANIAAHIDNRNYSNTHSFTMFRTTFPIWLCTGDREKDDDGAIDDQAWITIRTSLR